VTEVAVVGGGQAGLAMGHYLQRSGRDFVILDAGERVGDAWRSRWESLRLFTPGQYSGLPGYRWPAPKDVHLTKEQVADYLESYAADRALPVELNTQVTAVERSGGGYLVSTHTGDQYADQVVVATGPFQVPVTPNVANQLGPMVTQIHSAEYRRPGQLPPEGTVLVVGGGNSGYQIAAELASTGRDVHLSRGAHRVSVPQRMLGRDIFWWLSTTRVMNVTARSWLGRRMQENEDIVIGLRPQHLAEGGVTFHPRTVEGNHGIACFEDGTSLAVSVVIWCTGFRQDHSFVRVPDTLDEQGGLLHHRGVTPASGLYVLGLPWLHTTGSALLGFVARDAAYLAKQISVKARTGAS
jgi:putative flavoprotein involved in K+ transport